MYALMVREEFLAYRDCGRAILKDRKRLEQSLTGFLLSRLSSGSELGLRAAELLGKHTGMLPFEEPRRHKPLVIEAPKNY